MSPRLIAPTTRKKIGKKEAARLFLIHDGICCNCLQRITSAETWFIEHVDALVLGGAETDDNRRPAHVRCKAKKDAQDAAKRAKRDTIITKNWQRPDARRSRLSGSPIRYSKPQGRYVDRSTGEPVQIEDTK